MGATFCVFVSQSKKREGRQGQRMNACYGPLKGNGYVGNCCTEQIITFYAGLNSLEQRKKGRVNEILPR